ncbi:hypothetical protein BBP40_004946 [Aspergillus hancockii]|nr:hypothetical protein BBP40_004946 [Aspergillus hancockii]
MPPKSNLAYEAKEPVFLQRLRNQYGDTSGRLERPVARPRLKKDYDDDDEPTYVDEESNEVISKEEYEALVRDSNKEAEDTGKETPDQEQTISPSSEGKESTEKGAPVSKQNMAEIGGPKKRKQAKIIGEEEPPTESKDTQLKDAGARKPKQKKKKIKLSFDE